MKRCPLCQTLMVKGNNFKMYYSDTLGDKKGKLIGCLRCEGHLIFDSKRNVVSVITEADKKIKAITTDKK